METSKITQQSQEALEKLIPEEIREEIDHYEKEVHRFLREEMHPEVFRRFRLQHGIYGQRQEGVQMIRIKVPFGGLTPIQMRVVADVVDEYSPRPVAHLTTRQNFQFHFVDLKRTAGLMRTLAAHGMTTREACGNTVRNVTASPHSGVCPHEAFDVTPYAMATYELFIRNPVCENLPRKFKIAFSDCAEDTGLTPIHDVGLIAMKQPVDGKEVPGFRVTVGGGLGPSPRRPYVLEEFVPLQDYLAVCEAVVRVFNRHGNRKNRTKARIKFLIEKIGFEKFYALYKKEYDLIQESRDPAAYAVPAPREEEPPAGSPLPPLKTRNGNGREDHRFSEWMDSNATSQKQPGYFIVQVRLVIGDITTAQLRSVATMTERYASGLIRITPQQNFVLRWVRQSDLYALFKELDQIGLALPGAESIGDVIACPGADTCGLGITGSKGLGKALTDLFHNGLGNTDDLKGVTIKVSGCPNSCAQHHIASIGFHGMGQKVNGTLVPAYQLHLGGRIEESGVTFGIQTTLRFPAKRVPELVKYLISMYREQRQKGEDFPRFVERTGRARFREVLKPFTTLPPAQNGNRSLYYDWDADQAYSMDDIGAGECAGGVVDMIEQHFEDSKYELANANVLIQKGNPFDSLTRADLAVIAAARGLLVLQGIDPASNEAVLGEFKDKITQKGIVPAEKLMSYEQHVEAFRSQNRSLDHAQDYVDAAKELIGVCQKAFQSMDANLKMKEDQAMNEQESPGQPPAQSSDTPDSSAGQKATVHMDLRTVKCPMNYVKAKLRMETMEIGEWIELLLDEGEPIENVPRSMQADGQKLVETEQIDSYYRVLVEKVK